MQRIYGVYHADGGLLGELRYVLGKLLGTAHCSLCDITHGAVSMKSTFRACMERLGVPVELVHLNEQSSELETFTAGRTPCVVGETAEGFRLLLSADELDLMAGDVEPFEAVLGERLASGEG